MSRKILFYPFTCQNSKIRKQFSRNQKTYAFFSIINLIFFLLFRFSSFITADKAVGAPGFRAVWTEVQDRSSGTPCHHSYFRCSKSSFCIPAELRCDGVYNCGTEEGENDTSDEEQCKYESCTGQYYFFIYQSPLFTQVSCCV